MNCPSRQLQLLSASAIFSQTPWRRQLPHQPAAWLAALLQRLEQHAEAAMPPAAMARAASMRQPCVTLQSVLVCDMVRCVARG